MLTGKHDAFAQGDDEARALAIWSALIRVTRRIGVAGAERLGQRGLGPAQFELLRRIGATAGLSQQDLANGLEVSRGNISRLIGKLEADGLVRREPESAAYRLELTEAGRTTLGELVADHDRFIRDRFGVLSAEEQHRLIDLLWRLEE